jgi:hypothetical protein
MRLAHLRYRASKHDCERCPVKPRGCPNATARKIAQTETYQTLRRDQQELLIPLLLDSWSSTNIAKARALALA